VQFADQVLIPVECRQQESPDSHDAAAQQAALVVAEVLSLFSSSRPGTPTANPTTRQLNLSVYAQRFDRGIAL